MDKYYFQLVCVDEQNATGYRILNQEMIGNLDDVHKYVENHLNDHSPEHTKWMLLPYKRSEIKIIK